jgi:glycosyltransferase involved in cell wall biosynthesis
MTSTDYRDQVVALIPAFNEDRVIGPVLARTQKQLPTVVVDDGSSDSTPQLVDDSGAKLIQHSVNRGKGAALQTGFEWALEAGAKAVLTLDADGQHDPLEIPKFLVVYRATGADLIVGRRRFRDMPFPRNLTNPFGSWLLSLIVGERIADNQSGFRLYGRRLVEVLDFKTTGFEFEVEVFGAAICNDLRIEWVDIKTIYHTETTSYFHPILDSGRFFGALWRARTWKRPKGGESS